MMPQRPSFLHHMTHIPHEYRSRKQRFPIVPQSLGSIQDDWHRLGGVRPKPALGRLRPRPERRRLATGKRAIQLLVDRPVPFLVVTPFQRSLSFLRTRRLANPKSDHVNPATGTTGHGPAKTTGQAKVGGFAATSAAKPAPTSAPPHPPGLLLADRIKQARMKGYEGDPCSNCQQMTLVRSGACAKCDTCGETNECS